MHSSPSRRTFSSPGLVGVGLVGLFLFFGFSVFGPLLGTPGMARVIQHRQGVHYPSDLRLTIRPEWTLVAALSDDPSDTTVMTVDESAWRQVRDGQPFPVRRLGFMTWPATESTSDRLGDLLRDSPEFSIIVALAAIAVFARFLPPVVALAVPLVGTALLLLPALMRPAQTVREPRDAVASVVDVPQGSRSSRSTATGLLRAPWDLLVLTYRPAGGTQAVLTGATVDRPARLPQRGDRVRIVYDATDPFVVQVVNASRHHVDTRRWRAVIMCGVLALLTSAFTFDRARRRRLPRHQ